MDIFQIINELGEHREDYYNSVSPPIFQTAMFSSKTVEDMRKLIANESDEPFYTRGVNPTIKMLCEKLASLEHAQDALVFASGSGACSAGIMSQVKAEDHIICVQKPYSWTKKLLTEYLPRFGVNTTFVNGTNENNFLDAIQPNTRLFVLESPNSWTFELQNIPEIVKIAKKHHIKTFVDNSFASPLCQNPITWGVDLVAHSATKYISGHSDAVGGVLCGSREDIKKIFASEFMTLGAIISPFNAWLLLRGLRTLPLRMERIGNTTQKVINYLQNHPKVDKIFYPFHHSHPQYTLANEMMTGKTGQFTIKFRAKSVKDMESMCNSFKRFLLAASWGGYESLAFPACIFATSENYQGADFTFDMVRFCTGLEDAELIIADLEQAMEKL
jgi:cystathionine beta-lyase/cystathionine gamma-synthase